MEASAILRSFHCVQPSFEKPGIVPTYNALLNKSICTRGLRVGRRIISSQPHRRNYLLPYVKASETTLDAASNIDISEKNPEAPEKTTTVFPSGLETLVLEVCDETEIAEIKLKVGDFEMHLRRDIGAVKTPPGQVPIVSPTTPPPIPTEPMVDSASAAPPSPPPTKASPATTNPFANVSSAKASKLANLEASGSNAFVLVSSPTVGSFRRGRTLKGKKQPPSCKEGDIIKEGQIIGYLDQFGNELPVRSDVAGEVLKVLYSDGEAVGYGDPLVAVLPSFHDIK
ncbi:hypothetical protein QJS10_CPB21g01450 [Acorus calamus]|uniref:Lipoyl-binding domain-containing protein n=1 Tax=Acorus calamus TaxID=4465 RepID=A0AAV9C432_ACOCL|nr:hypothetical protein QJS10_CPB21g01450 [Acorus calamus]